MHEDYGDVVRFKGFLGQDYLQLTDPKALTHVLQNACYTWEKSEPNRERLIRLTGKSVVFVNGSFGLPSLSRAIVLIFEKKLNRSRS